MTVFGPAKKLRAPNSGLHSRKSDIAPHINANYGWMMLPFAA